MPLTVDQILAGTTTGRMQSVGQMSVIPLLDAGNGQDETFAPPNFEAGTQGYGRVNARNTTADRPTIMPTGAAFVTPEAAQDHAVPGASLFSGGESKGIENSYCVQQTQGGLIPQKEREFTILPVALRPFALAHRTEGRYDAMWPHLRAFRETFGDAGPGNLVDFLKRFEKELDQFVAEFELVPGQIGALVLIGGKIVGIERAPTVAFWEKLWTPLIRVCYGSLALRVGKTNRALPGSRTPLAKSTSIDGLRAALADSKAASEKLVTQVTSAVKAKVLGDQVGSEKLGQARVLTVASQEYAGQVVQNGDKPVYASICVAAA